MAPRKNTTTQTLRRPSRQMPISLRGLGTILLTLVLPPVGLLVMWSAGVFRTRGRLLLTTLATIEMMAAFVLMTPHAELANQYPLPVPPAPVTQAPPDSEKLSALYNIEELLYQQQLAQVIADGGNEEDIMTDEQLEQLPAIKHKAVENRVYDVEYKTPAELLEMEPELNPCVKGGLYIPRESIIDPFLLCIALAENAADNGVHFELATKVIGIEQKDGAVTTVKTDKGDIECKYVINADLCIDCGACADACPVGAPEAE